MCGSPFANLNFNISTKLPVREFLFHSLHLLSPSLQSPVPPSHRFSSQKKQKALKGNTLDFLPPVHMFIPLDPIFSIYISKTFGPNFRKYPLNSPIMPRYIIHEVCCCVPSVYLPSCVERAGHRPLQHIPESSP